MTIDELKHEIQGMSPKYVVSEFDAYKRIDVDYDQLNILSLAKDEWGEWHLTFSYTTVPKKVLDSLNSIIQYCKDFIGTNSITDSKKKQFVEKVAKQHLTNGNVVRIHAAYTGNYHNYLVTVDPEVASNHVFYLTDIDNGYITVKGGKGEEMAKNLWEKWKATEQDPLSLAGTYKNMNDFIENEYA